MNLPHHITINKGHNTNPQPPPEPIAPQRTESPQTDTIIE